MDARFVSKPDGRGWNKPVVTVQSQAPSKDNSGVNTNCLRGRLATPRLTLVPFVRPKLEGTGQNQKSSDKPEQMMQKATQQDFFCCCTVCCTNTKRSHLLLIKPRWQAVRLQTIILICHQRVWSQQFSDESRTKYRTKGVTHRICDPGKIVWVSLRVAELVFPTRDSPADKDAVRTQLVFFHTYKTLSQTHSQNNFQILLLIRIQVSFERFLFFTAAKNALLITKAHYIYYYYMIIIIITGSNKESGMLFHGSK